MSDLILDIRNLTTVFRGEGGTELVAVNDVSLQVAPGEAVALVGESGSGKSVSMLSVLGLIPEKAGRVRSGEIWFEGRDLTKLPKKDLRSIRGNDIAMIFQDPMTSLNPSFKIGRQITEPLIRHRGMSRRDARKRAVELLSAVGIPSPTDRLDDYPHEFSGGMRQRVMIAMALSCDPQVLIADEPTTALDVTVQSQILDLLRQLQSDLGMALIIVTHDLGVVAGTATQVNVMYAGEVVERGPVDTVFADPRHPYTIGLLESIPRVDARRGESLPAIPGRPPALDAMGSGCRFQPRCRFALDIAKEQHPVLAPVDNDPEHSIACWTDVRTGLQRTIGEPAKLGDPT